MVNGYWNTTDLQFYTFLLMELVINKHVARKILYKLKDIKANFFK